MTNSVQRHVPPFSARGALHHCQNNRDLQRLMARAMFACGRYSFEEIHYALHLSYFMPQGDERVANRFSFLPHIVQKRGDGLMILRFFNAWNIHLKHISLRFSVNRIEKAWEEYSTKSEAIIEQWERQFTRLHKTWCKHDCHTYKKQELRRMNQKKQKEDDE
eukprot:Hpha_TRINITY_DN17250_c0_g1::TRINITY_DN17250_c0_g1_i1::g.17785::m.17785